jgi:hypothetical protein
MKIGVILRLAAAMVFAAPPAFADPIVITRGFVTIGSSFEANHPPFGFQLSGDGTDIAGVTFDQGTPIVRSGQTVDLSRTVPVTSLVFGPFEQTVQGVRYNDVVIQGSLRLAATPFVVSGASGSFDTPFMMTGAVSIFEHVPFQGPGAMLLTTQLTGSGSARIDLARDFGDGSFSTGSIGFVFSAPAVAPVPEPGTLLLMAGGLAAVVRRSRRCLSARRMTLK